MDVLAWIASFTSYRGRTGGIRSEQNNHIIITIIVINIIISIITS
jgi:hypothetical protein